MQTDERGCSTTQPGREQWEEFYSPTLRARLVQYDYRTPDGALFSCVRRTLDKCRASRDKWLAEQAQKEA